MKDLTTGSITRHLLSLSGFLLVSMVFQTAYLLLDLYWVGRLGKEATAAVTLAANQTWIVLALTQVLGIGTATLISHAAGRKDQAAAHTIFNQSLVLGNTIGVVYFLLAFFTRQAYSNSLSADASTARLSIDYLTWFIPAMALQFPLVTMGSALRGSGNMKPSMIVQVVTVVLNMVLAPVLVFGWGTGRALGVAGAAISSLVAILLGTIGLALYFMRPGEYLKFHIHQWRPSLGEWGRMLKIGLPAGGEFALISVYAGLVYLIIKDFGAAAQAGFGVGVRVVQACFLPVVAISFALSPIAGQNFAARNPARIREVYKVGALLICVIMSVLIAMCHISPEALVRPFSKDPAVVAFAARYMRIVSYNFLASGLILVSSSTFQALGNTIPPLLASCLRLLLFSIPAWIISRAKGFDIDQVWWLSVATVTFQMVVVLWLLRREFSRKFAAMDSPPARPPEAAAAQA